MQQIPAKNKEIRLLFKAATNYEDIEVKDNYCILDKVQDVETDAGWLNVKRVEKGMYIYSDIGLVQIKQVEELDAAFKLYF